MAEKVAETDPPVVVEIELGDTVMVRGCTRGPAGPGVTAKLPVAKYITGDVSTIELKPPAAVVLKAITPCGNSRLGGTLPMTEEEPTRLLPENAFRLNVPEPSVPNPKAILVTAWLNVIVKGILLAWAGPGEYKSFAPMVKPPGFPEAKPPGSAVDENVAVSPETV